MDQKQKNILIEKLKKSINTLQTLQILLRKKNPPHEMLYPVIVNAVIGMTNALLYLEEKHPYMLSFNEDFFNNLQVTMHITFFSDLHTGTEECLAQIIKNKGFVIKVNKLEQAKSIIKSIERKTNNSSGIKNDLKKIRNLVSKNPTFNDFLNTVLNNSPGLSETYKKECRLYFDALSIIRNKVSHSRTALTENEKARLTSAKFKTAIDKGGNLQMTFEGYIHLIDDVVRFLDTIHANFN